jgi:hypothetical protein
MIRVVPEKGKVRVEQPPLVLEVVTDPEELAKARAFREQ